MERFKTLLAILLCLACCSLGEARDEGRQGVLPQRTSAVMPGDSIELSLLTCGPGRETYSLFGHTAIRYHNLTTGVDLAINYGIFSFHADYFILRFVFGLTDYSMGICSMDDFLAEYRAEGRWVRQQTLRLTAGEKLRIVQDLMVNYEPANRVYRYNFFYDNCTTRARDVLIRSIDGKVNYPPATNDDGTDPSYRTMVHQWTSGHAWDEEGINMLLGAPADVRTPYLSRQFLPDSLSHDFALAIVERNDESRSLVESTTMLLPVVAMGDGNSMGDILAELLSPENVGLVIFVIVLAITFVDYRHNKYHAWLDVVLYGATGLAGLILAAMIFSQHPTVSLNPQILVLNPLNLVFMFPLIGRQRRGRSYWYGKAVAVFVCIFVVYCLVMHYPSALSFYLALSLFTRVMYTRIVRKAKYIRINE